ncbi:MAG TPA: isochorismatase family protein [Stellaceae bacterium]|nr:isochorismatase family protein [Stellaceae bacterium]
MHHRSGFARMAIAGIAAALAGIAGAQPLSAQGVIDEWATVKAPPPPVLGRVTVDPKTTALLVLDLAPQTCNAQQRPRCIAMLPRLKPLLAKARAKGWFVVYTLGGASTPADILPEVAMLGSEPVLKSGPDKFVATDLEKILKDHGIKTVIAIGAAAHGAVLHTAAGAAFRGFDVVVPVDGMAAETAYAEQYTAWDLVNAPRLSDRVKLTALDWID